MRKAFIKSLLDEARQNSNIILVTGDLGYGVVDDFSHELPDQFINAGISEQAMMGLAGGLASEGKRVFVYSIGNFSTLRCLEQIRNDVCAMDNPVVIVSVGAGYSYGSQGYTHHAVEDIAIMRALPNLEVLLPSDSEESRVITQYLCASRSPAYLRLGKDGEPLIHTKGSIRFDHGPYKIIEGGDGAIMCAGSIANEVIKAVNLLSAKGIELSVFLVPSLLGLTQSFIQELAKFPKLFSVEEHAPKGGFGTAVLEKLNLFNEGAKLHIIAADQSNLSLIGSQDFLRKNKGISHENIISRVLDSIV